MQGADGMMIKHWGEVETRGSGRRHVRCSAPAAWSGPAPVPCLAYPHAPFQAPFPPSSHCITWASQAGIVRQARAWMATACVADLASRPSVALRLSRKGRPPGAEPAGVAGATRYTSRAGKVSRPLSGPVPCAQARTCEGGVRVEVPQYAQSLHPNHVMHHPCPATQVPGSQILPQSGPAS